jgi:hypothetical protein
MMKSWEFLADGAVYGPAMVNQNGQGVKDREISCLEKNTGGPDGPPHYQFQKKTGGPDGPPADFFQ